MSDGDPCQCLFDHEAAMRRLISWLRESQSDCVDGDCLPENPGAAAGSSMLLWTLLWGLVALALFMTRPNSLRGSPTAEKPRGDRDDGAPPPPGLT